MHAHIHGRFSLARMGSYQGTKDRTISPTIHFFGIYDNRESWSVQTNHMNRGWCACAHLNNSIDYLLAFIVFNGTFRQTQPNKNHKNNCRERSHHCAITIRMSVYIVLFSCFVLASGIIVLSSTCIVLFNCVSQWSNWS